MNPQVKKDQKPSVTVRKEEVHTVSFTKKQVEELLIHQAKIEAGFSSTQMFTNIQCEAQIAKDKTISFVVRLENPINEKVTPVNQA